MKHFGKCETMLIGLLYGELCPAYDFSAIKRTDNVRISYTVPTLAPSQSYKVPYPVVARVRIDPSSILNRHPTDHSESPWRFAQIFTSSLPKSLLVSPSTRATKSR